MNKSNEFLTNNNLYISNDKYISLNIHESVIAEKEAAGAIKVVYGYDIDECEKYCWIYPRDVRLFISKNENQINISAIESEYLVEHSEILCALSAHISKELALQVLYCEKIGLYERTNLDFQTEVKLCFPYFLRINKAVGVHYKIAKPNDWSDGFWLCKDMNGVNETIEFCKSIETSFMNWDEALFENRFGITLIEAINI